MARVGTLLLALALLGCSGQQSAQFASTDITGAEYAHDFALTDHTGQPRVLADFKGKAVAIFFGFTQCPDVCPTTMSNMAQVMRLLGDDAKRVQVLFVTIDPERDTRELLAEYVPAFHPSFVGLYGDAAATAKTAKEFKVFYQKQAGSSPEHYTMDHSAGTYVFDAQGRLRLYVRHGEKPETIAADLKKLLAGA